MKKRIKEIICLLLVFACLLPTTLAANANEIQPRYTTIESFLSELYINSSGYATIYSSVDTNVTSYTVSLSVELQRSSNNRTWSSVRSWNGSQAGHISLDKNQYVSSGYTYRIHATATVTNSSGRVVETATKDSATVSY